MSERYESQVLVDSAYELALGSLKARQGVFRFGLLGLSIDSIAGVHTTNSSKKIAMRGFYTDPVVNSNLCFPDVVQIGTKAIVDNTKLMMHPELQRSVGVLPESQIIKLVNATNPYGVGPNNIYAGLTNAAIGLTDRSNATILELGAGSGVQSIYAIKGEDNAAAICIENSTELLSELGMNVSLNFQGDPSRRISAIQSDIRDLTPNNVYDVFDQRLGRAPDMAIINIGTHYEDQFPGTHEAALNLAGQTESIQTVVLSGYRQCVEGYEPDHAIHLMRRSGFNHFDIVSTEHDFCSVIARRN